MEAAKQVAADLVGFRYTPTRPVIGNATCAHHCGDVHGNGHTIWVDSDGGNRFAFGNIHFKGNGVGHGYEGARTGNGIGYDLDTSDCEGNGHSSYRSEMSMWMVDYGSE
jgi:hypothetical protein